MDCSMIEGELTLLANKIHDENLVITLKPHHLRTYSQFHINPKRNKDAFSSENIIFKSNPNTKYIPFENLQKYQMGNKNPVHLTNLFRFRFRIKNAEQFISAIW